MFLDRHQPVRRAAPGTTKNGFMRDTDNNIRLENATGAGPAAVRPLRYATVLSVAGSDSIGGAGIQADIKTCTALGVYAMTVVTAVTAQNTVGVRLYCGVGGAMARAQMEAVFDDETPDAVKIGMVPDADTAVAVAGVLRSRYAGPVVLDPVAVATSGDRLSDDSAAGAVVRELFPLAAVITPNIPEARMLTGMEITSEAGMEAAAREIIRHYGARAVLVKGGHLAEAGASGCADILVDGTSTHIYRGEVVDTPNTHGTGCTLSSAIASYMARGYALADAVAHAKDWLAAALRSGAAYSFGHGHGPVNHLHGICRQ